MTRRLLLSYLTVTLIVLVVLEVPLAVFYDQREEERFITDAERDAVVLASFYEDLLHLGTPADEQVATDYAARTGARIVLLDRDGISLLDTAREASRDFSTRPEVITALNGSRSTGIRRSETLDTDLLYVAVPVASGGEVHGALRFTIDASAVGDRVWRFWLGLIAIAAFVLLATAVLGWAIARSITRPLRQLERAASRFAAGDLTGSPVPGEAPPEIQRLSRTMNTMAGRLDELIEVQRAFVSDASHQLRSPLTALRLRLENIESRLTDPHDSTEIERAIEELGRLEQLVGDLLRLARAERYPPPAAVDVVCLAAERVDTWTAMAESRDVGIELVTPSASIEVEAVPGAVEQILDDLIDNALNAAPAGTAVTVRIEQQPDQVTLTVADRGPGLSDEDKAHAIQRFWRGDHAQPGSGLGLAIVQTLATASGGELTLGDGPAGGLAATVSLPIQRQREKQAVATGPAAPQESPRAGAPAPSSRGPG